MKAKGIRHDTTVIVRSCGVLRTFAADAQCPDEVRAALTIVLDSLQDVSQVLHDLTRPPGLDRDLVGKIIDALLGEAR